MRRLHTLTLPTLLMTMLASTSAHAAPWLESDAFSALENANGGSCKVDAADLDGDGFIDLVFANTGGTLNGNMASAQQQQAFKNDGAGNFTDISAEVFNGVEYTGRAVKIRDIDYDGDNDIILGTTWIEQSQLFINDGGNFVNETDPALPMRKASVGDLEVGDVDDDGDLDLVLTNWGENAREDDVVNAGSAGGVTLLWSQDGDPAEYGDKGSAIFVDVTATNMPVHRPAHGLGARVHRHQQRLPDRHPDRVQVVHAGQEPVPVHERRQRELHQHPDLQRPERQPPQRRRQRRRGHRPQRRQVPRRRRPPRRLQRPQPRHHQRRRLAASPPPTRSGRRSRTRRARTPWPGSTTTTRTRTPTS
jgi:hypothetical protein